MMWEQPLRSSDSEAEAEETLLRTIGELIADAGVPVVPVALRGTRRILPVGRTLLRRGPITVTVAPPVGTADAGWAGAVELHAATRAAILRRCGEPTR